MKVRDKLIHLGASQAAVACAINIINMQNDTIQKLKKKNANQVIALQQKDRENILKNQRLIVDISDRDLDVVTVDSKKSKITINPCTGRVSLKVSKYSSEGVRCELLDLTLKVIKFEGFDTFTYRGKIGFDRRQSCYVVSMQTSNKMFPSIKFKLNS